VRGDRLSESLTIEFRLRGDSRIAVGDEVWLDMNAGDAEPEILPMPSRPETATPTPAQ
jgi:hypothetical protein